MPRSNKYWFHNREDTGGEYIVIYKSHTDANNIVYGPFTKADAEEWVKLAKLDMTQVAICKVILP
jgi:hypothetical protein